MNSGKGSRKKRGAPPETPSFSTSKGRANFARALETTASEKTVVGFARYNTPVAALVPIEAVRMLAGQGEIEPAVRAKIVRMARLFLTSEPPKRSPRKSPASGAGAKKKSTKAAPRPKAKPKKSQAKRTAKRKSLGKTV